MNLDSKRFDIVCSISSSREVGQVKLDLIPSLIKTHGHSADERLYSGRALIVRSSESSPHIFVV